MDFPKHITFLSDGCEVEFIEEIKVKKGVERNANYRFIVAKENLGKIFPIFLKQIQVLLKSERIAIADGFMPSNSEDNSKKVS